MFLPWYWYSGGGSVAQDYANTQRTEIPLQHYNIETHIHGTSNLQCKNFQLEGMQQAAKKVTLNQTYSQWGGGSILINQKMHTALQQCFK